MGLNDHCEILLKNAQMRIYSMKNIEITLFGDVTVAFNDVILGMFVLFVHDHFVCLALVGDENGRM